MDFGGGSTADDRGDCVNGTDSQPPGANRPVTVFQDEPAFTADVSADGRLAAVFTQPYGNGTNQTPARIEVRNLQTGGRKTLAGGVSNVGTPGRPAAAFSPNARFPAYTWFDPQLLDTGMLQVIGVESGAQPRTLIPADASDIGIIPHGWSPDGKRILVLIHAGRPGGGFYQLDFTTGAFKRLFSRHDAGRVRSNVSALSPDNRDALPRPRDGLSQPLVGNRCRGCGLRTRAPSNGASRVLPVCPGNRREPAWKDAGPAHQRRRDIYVWY